MLPAFILAPAALAVTSVTVENHPNPLTLIEGETVLIHYDVAKPGGVAEVTPARDPAGTGKYDPSAPVYTSIPITDGGSLDCEPAAGKIALPLLVGRNWPAGPYIGRFHY